MIKILLADDHEILRSGLKLCVRDLVAHAAIDEAWDGDSAIEKIKKNEYELILLDVNMPRTDSFGLVSNILSIKPDAKILMFSINVESVFAKRYLQLGVKGYVSKAASATELGKAINTVLRNEVYLSDPLMQSLREDALGKNKSNPFDKLSPREFEIVQHLLSGQSITAICSALHLQSSTVGTHKARIFEKLQCKKYAGSERADENL